MTDVHLACCSDDGCSIGTCSNDFLCSTPCSKRGVQWAVVQLTWKGNFTLYKAKNGGLRGEEMKEKSSCLILSPSS